MALTEAGLLVECLPKIFLRAPSDKAPIVNPNLVTKAGFMFIVAHRDASKHFWNKSKEGSFISGNQYPMHDGGVTRAVRT